MFSLDPPKMIHLLDLTSLNDFDDEAAIIRLCHQARTPIGNVAAVCVYPRFVKLAATQLNNVDIRVATVCNFPGGKQSLAETVAEIEQAIQNGATEIDVVMPYGSYLLGEMQYCLNFLATCKSVCDERASLKVILETGALKESAIIAAATHDAINAGADFIKTSTGKYPVGATPRTAEIILKAIHASEYEVGFKASGGVRTLEQANIYLNLAANIMGRDWVSPEVFRIGASQLLQELLNTQPILSS